MSTKKRKKSNEDNQEYFAEEDNNKNYDKISFAKYHYMLSQAMLSNLHNEELAKTYQKEI